MFEQLGLIVVTFRTIDPLDLRRCFNTGDIRHTFGQDKVYAHDGLLKKYLCNYLYLQVI